MSAALVPPDGGLLLVDKPGGRTSHDVVARVRAVLGTRRVGHAGTLDPMATGLLVIAVDRSTKLLGHLALTDKSYTATIRLGQATSTDDADGEVTAAADPAGITDQQIAEAMPALTGDIDQVPSSVSAIKVDGRRAYARVRDGQEVDLPARSVHVARFDAVSSPRRGPGWIDLDVVVDCSTGTYVRALARDLGAALGVGGHLTRLRRTRVGPFGIDAAVDVYGTDTAQGPGRDAAEHPRRPPITAELAQAVGGALIPASEAVRQAFPLRALNAGEVEALGFGRPVEAAGLAGVYAALDSAGDLIALLAEDGPKARPVLVWRPAG